MAKDEFSLFNRYLLPLLPRKLKQKSSEGMIAVVCRIFQVLIQLSEVPMPFWKPVTLRAPLLLTLVALTTGFLSLIQYLIHKSRVNGAIVFAEQDFSKTTIFLFSYLPTIFATVYNLVWATIDLDTKRLEPYFQMSKAEGASAEHSLLLHYPFDLVVIPPIKALSLR